MTHTMGAHTGSNENERARGNRMSSVSARLEELRVEEKKAWRSRLDAELHVLTSKIAQIPWTPGGALLVRDEAERCEYFFELQTAHGNWARVAGLMRASGPAPRTSSIRLPSSSAARAARRKDFEELAIDHRALKTTLALARQVLSEDVEEAALIHRLEAVARKGIELMPRLARCFDIAP